MAAYAWCPSLHHAIISETAIKAYLLYDTKNHQLYVAFGNDCEEVARGLEKQGVKLDDISVSGVFHLTRGQCLLKIP